MELVTSTFLTEHQSSQNSKEEKKNISKPTENNAFFSSLCRTPFFVHFAVNRNQNSLSTAKAFFGGVWSSAIKHKQMQLHEVFTLQTSGQRLTFCHFMKSFQIRH